MSKLKHAGTQDVLCARTHLKCSAAFKSTKTGKVYPLRQFHMHIKEYNLSLSPAKSKKQHVGFTTQQLNIQISYHRRNIFNHIRTYISDHFNFLDHSIRDLTVQILDTAEDGPKTKTTGMLLDTYSNPTNIRSDPRMPPKKQVKSQGTATKNDQKDVPKCSSCSVWLHCYCAGIQRSHFERITLSFNCVACSLTASKTVADEMKSEISALKLEIQELKASLMQEKHASRSLAKELDELRRSRRTENTVAPTERSYTAAVVGPWCMHAVKNSQVSQASTCYSIF